MTITRFTGVFTLTTALSITSICLSAEHTKDSLETVKKNLAKEKAVLVDVREKSEWDDGHIEGALFLPLSQLRDGVTKAELERVLPERRIVYLHCASGRRVLSAGKILGEFGYDVRPLKSGYEDLIEAGFPKAKE